MSDYVTTAFGNALIEMMRKKSIEKITVDELCEAGGIGRATYFRNFKSKDEILTAYLIMKWRAYEQMHKLKEYKLNDSYRAINEHKRDGFVKMHKRELSDHSQKGRLLPAI